VRGLPNGWPYRQLTLSLAAALTHGQNACSRADAASCHMQARWPMVWGWIPREALSLHWPKRMPAPKAQKIHQTACVQVNAMAKQGRWPIWCGQNYPDVARGPCSNETAGPKWDRPQTRGVSSPGRAHSSHKRLAQQRPRGPAPGPPGFKNHLEIVMRGGATDPNEQRFSHVQDGRERGQSPLCRRFKKNAWQAVWAAAQDQRVHVVRAS